MFEIRQDESSKSVECVPFGLVCPIKLATILATYPLKDGAIQMSNALKYLITFLNDSSFNSEVINFKLAELFTTQVISEASCIIDEKTALVYSPVFDLFANNNANLSKEEHYYQLCESMNWNLYSLFFEYSISKMTFISAHLNDANVDKLLFKSTSFIIELMQLNPTLPSTYQHLREQALQLVDSIKAQIKENAQTLCDSCKLLLCLIKYYDWELKIANPLDGSSYDLPVTDNGKFAFIRQLLLLLEYRHRVGASDRSSFEHSVRLLYRLLIDNLQLFSRCDILESLSQVINRSSTTKLDTFWQTISASFIEPQIDNCFGDDLFIWDIVRCAQQINIKCQVSPELRRSLTDVLTFSVMLLGHRHHGSFDYANHLISERITLFSLEKLDYFNVQLNLNRLDQVVQGHKGGATTTTAATTKVFNNIFLNIIISPLETFDVLLSSLLMLNTSSTLNAYIIDLLAGPFRVLANYSTSTTEILSGAPQPMLICCLLSKFIENHSIIAIKTFDAIISSRLGTTIDGLSSEALFVNILVYFPFPSFPLSLLQSLNELAVLGRTHNWTGRHSSLIISYLISILAHNETKAEVVCHLTKQYHSNCQLKLARADVRRVLELAQI